MAETLITVSAHTGRSLDGLLGLMWRTVDLFLAGDRRAGRLRRELQQRLDVDRCDCLAYVAAAVDVMTAMRAGRLEEAERLADACLQLGLDVGDADALGWYGAQLMAIRWLQGRAGELLPMALDLAHSPTVAEPIEAFAGAVAAVAAAAGDERAGAPWRACERPVWGPSGRRAAGWSQCSVSVRPRTRWATPTAAEAYELLAPFADLPVMASLAVACFGSAHRPLGIAARTMGDLDRAVGHLEAASTADLALGHRPCHAIDLALLADLLEQRAGASDAERAAALRRGSDRRGAPLRPDGASSCGSSGLRSGAALPRSAAARKDDSGGSAWERGRRSSPTPWDSATSASSSSGPGLPSPRSSWRASTALACRGMPEVPVLDAPAKAAYPPGSRSCSRRSTTPTRRRTSSGPPRAGRAGSARARAGDRHRSWRTNPDLRRRRRASAGVGAQGDQTCPRRHRRRRSRPRRRARPAGGHGDALHVRPSGWLTAVRSAASQTVTPPRRCHVRGIGTTRRNHMDTCARPATSAGRIRCWSASAALAGLLLVAVALALSTRPSDARPHCPDEAEHCAGEPGPDDTIGPPPPTPQPQPPAPYGTPRRFAYDALDGLALGVDAAIATRLAADPPQRTLPGRSRRSPTHRRRAVTR